VINIFEFVLPSVLLAIHRPSLQPPFKFSLSLNLPFLILILLDGFSFYSSKHACIIFIVRTYNTRSRFKSMCCLWHRLSRRWKILPELFVKGQLYLCLAISRFVTSSYYMLYVGGTDTSIGCDTDVANNIFVDPTGEQYLCSETNLRPDDADALSNWYFYLIATLIIIKANMIQSNSKERPDHWRLVYFDSEQ
jgi:hypothetical protein